MRHCIKYNRNTSTCFNDDQTYDLMFLHRQAEYINDLLIRKGYVYLNGIYEVLGVKWNPKNENPCHIYINDKSTIDIDIRTVDDGYEIIITW